MFSGNECNAGRMRLKNILVTGGCGFIGANFIRLARERLPFVRIVNLDKLTYAGNPENLAGIAEGVRYRMVKGDICDHELVDRLFVEERIDTVVHFAAESHVDRSITGPAEFIRTNIQGTFTLLEAARRAWLGDGSFDISQARFLHVSTDEVYGSLGETGFFTEETPYDPRSPYSASKASSDHLVSAYFHTYGLPVLITNCSNNYGPYQFPEKLIPLMIHNALNGRDLPVYGDGGNVRDWLYVQDHCTAILKVLEGGRPGQTYNIGGNTEKRNIEVVQTICDLLDAKAGLLSPEKTRRSLIRFVVDRPGHDRRYAIDAGKLKAELGWQPSTTFEEGIRRTIDWYLDNPGWTASVVNGSYREYCARQYGSNPEATRFKVALVGGKGMLARMILQNRPAGWEIHSFDLPEFDITDPDRVLATFRELRPDIILNCAACTNVDGCESDAGTAMRVNGDAPGFLAHAAIETGALLVHISTDYVFDGSKQTPCSEEDAPGPRSVYGRSKLAGETAVISSGLRRYFIVRTSWLYGPGGRNFVESILRLAAEREELRIVADQTGSPTYTGDLARAIFNLVGLAMNPSQSTSGDLYGIYHFSNEGTCSWYDFAVEILKNARNGNFPLRVKTVVPIETKDYPLPAERPACSVLNKDKYCRATGAFVPTWQESLEEYFRLRSPSDYGRN